MTKKLKVGDKAPDFGLKSSKSKTIVLYFYPKDDTPGCTKEACSLRDGFKELKKKGIDVIGVSPDSKESHEKFSNKYSLPFKLIPDTDKELAKKYGVWGKKKFMGREYMGILRTTFIIQNGKIIHIIDKVDTGNHSKQILDVLKK